MTIVSYTDQGLCLGYPSALGPNFIVPVKYDIKINDYNFNENQSYEYPDKIVKISGIRFDEIKITAKVVEFDCCKIKKIEVIGDVIVQNASEEIDEVKATGDIHLFACPSIKNIISLEGKIFITRLHPSWFDYKYNVAGECKTRVQRKCVLLTPPKQQTTELDKYKKDF